MLKEINIIIVLLVFLVYSTPMKAQEQFITEENFQSLFIITGYSTALGAAMGAAIMGLTKKPSENVRFLAIGASLGFISGSLLGGYINILTPMMLSKDSSPNEYEPHFEKNQKGFKLSPLLDEDYKLKALVASVNIINF